MYLTACVGKSWQTLVYLSIISIVPTVPIILREVYEGKPPEGILAKTAIWNDATGRRYLE